MQLRHTKYSCLAAWSPASFVSSHFVKNIKHRLLLATASIVDNAIASNDGPKSFIQLVSCNLSADRPNTDQLLPIGRKLSAPSGQEVSQLAWTSSGGSSRDGGLIVCGSADGTVALCQINDWIQFDNGDLEYNSKPLELLWQRGDNSRIESGGPIVSLDANKLQSELLGSSDASGSISVWDSNRMESGPTVSAVAAPLDCRISWNPQTAHVFAAVGSAPVGVNGGLTIFDIRRCSASNKNHLAPLMCLTPAHCGAERLTLMEWHPSLATQLCLASGDDVRSVVQLWDLRFAASPVSQFNQHSGSSLLSMAWNSFDTGCLLTSDSSARLLCWDPRPTSCSFAAAHSPDSESVAQLARARLIGRCFTNLAWCPAEPALFSAITTDGQLGIFNILGGGCGFDNDDNDGFSNHNEPTGLEFESQDTASLETWHQKRRLRTLSKVSMQQPADDPFAEVHQPSGPIRVWYNANRAFNWLAGAGCGVRFGFGGRLVNFSSDRRVFIGQMDSQTVAAVDELPAMVARRAREFENALAEGGDDLGGYCGSRASESGIPDSEIQIWRFLEANFNSNPSLDFIKLLGYGQDNGDDAPDSDRLIAALVSGRLDAAIEQFLAEGRLLEALLLAGSCIDDSSSNRIYSGTRTRVLDQLRLDTGSSTSEISRLVEAIVIRDISGYVNSNSNNNENSVAVDDGLRWRRQLAFVLAYSDVESLPAFAEFIGRRLERVGSSAASAAAAICYACSGSWRRLAVCLAAEASGSSITALQLAVQAGEVLQRAVGGLLDDDCANVDDAITDAAVELYAGALANWGQLLPALNCCIRRLRPSRRPDGFDYFGDSRLAVLAYRLWRALGHDGPASIGVWMADPFAERTAATADLMNSAARKRREEQNIASAYPVPPQSAAAYPVPPPQSAAAYPVPPPQSAAAYPVPPPQSAAAYPVPPPQSAAAYPVPPPQSAAAYPVKPQSAAAYPVPPPQSAAAYPVPPPQSAAAYPVPPPQSAAAYPVPPPQSAAAYSVPPPQSAAAYPVPPPQSAAAYPVPPPQSAAAYPVPPPQSAAAYPVPPPQSAAAYSVPPPQSAAAYPVPPPQSAAAYPVPPPQSAAAYPVPPPQSAAAYPVPPPQSAAAYPVPPPQSAAAYPVPPPQSAAPYPVPPPQSAAAYPVPPPQSAAAYSVPPPQSAAAYPVPPPQSAAAYPVPPPQSAAAYPVPPPQSAAAYPVPPPQSAAPYPVPPPQSAAAYPVPPPQSAAAYPVPPQSASAYPVLPPQSATALYERPCLQKTAVFSPSLPGQLAVAASATTGSFYNPLAPLPVAASAHSFPSVPSKPPPILRTPVPAEELSLFRGGNKIKSAEDVPQQFYNPSAWSASIASSSSNPPPPSQSSPSASTIGRSQSNLISNASPANRVAADLADRFSKALTSLARDCRGRAQQLLTDSSNSANAVKLRHIVVKMNDAEKKSAALAQLLGSSSISSPVLEGLGSILVSLERGSLTEALANLNSAVQSGGLEELRSHLPGLKLLIQAAVELRQF